MRDDYAEAYWGSIILVGVTLLVIVKTAFDVGFAVFEEIQTLIR